MTISLFTDISAAAAIRALMKFCSFRTRFIACRIVSSIRNVGSITTVNSQAIQNEVNSDRSPSMATDHTSNNIIDHVHYMHDFCSLVRNLSVNSKNYGALRQLDSMLAETHLLDSATSVLVIDGLCRLSKLNRAVTVLSNLRKKGNVSDSFLYSLVIYCLVRDGGINGVESVWNEALGSKSSSDQRIDASDYVIYTCKSSRVLEIESVCKRVLKDGWVLRQQSCLALIGALCRKNKSLLANDVLKNMKKKGFKPDNLTYLVLFQCFCRNGYLAEADPVLRKLVRRNYCIDICVYGSFLYGLCKMGLLREADKLFDKMLERDRVESPGIVRLKEGRRAIFQLNCSGVIPEIVVYETYFRSLCSVGRLDQAEKLLKEMMMKRSVPEVCVYKSFVKSLFQAGRAEDAIRFFNAQRIKEIVPMEGIAESVIMGLCQMGRVDDAWEIFYENFTSYGFVFATDICNAVLSSYWRSDRQTEAERLFERMQEGSFGGPNVSTYIVMVNGLCDKGNITEALSMFEEMLENNMPVNGTLYEVIIRGLCQSDSLAEAHKYLNKMIENGHLFSYISWKSLYDSNFVGSGNGVSLGF